MACVNANLDSKARATMWLLVYSGPSYRLYIKEQLDPKGFIIQTKRMTSANADPFFMHTFHLDINQRLSAAIFKVTLAPLSYISCNLIHTLITSDAALLKIISVSIKMCHIKVCPYHSRESILAFCPKASSIFILFISLTINHCRSTFALHIIMNFGSGASSFCCLLRILK